MQNKLLALTACLIVITFWCLYLISFEFEKILLLIEKI